MTLAAIAAAAPARRLDRLFYTGMSAAAAVVVFVGFAPTYYLRARVATEPLPLHLHVHGLLFSAWIGLLLVQTALVAARRVSWHRRLGAVGAALAAAAAMVGIAAGLLTARREAAFDPDGARRFLTIPLFSMLVFATLVAAAIAWRHRPETHKRLMLLATISILDAPIARWPGAPGAWGVFALLLVFVAVAILYDAIVGRRVHGAYVVGGALIVAGHVLREPIGRLNAWHAVAAVLLGTS